jgi:hypothetical protein
MVAESLEIWGQIRKWVAQSLVKTPKDAKKALYKGNKKKAVQGEKNALAEGDLL